MAMPDKGIRVSPHVSCDVHIKVDYRRKIDASIQRFKK